PGLKVHAARSRNRREGICGEHFSCGAVHKIDIAVTLRPNQDLAGLPFDRKIEKDDFINRVVVVQVVRTELVIPNRLAGIGIASKYSRGELVIAGPCVSIPWSRIRRAVIDEVEVRIVGNPSPDASSSDLPCIWRPALYS